MSEVLRVFEAFAGVGSQKMALRNLNIKHEVVGISEIDIDAIISYAYIHANPDMINHDIGHEEMKKVLKSKNIGYDYQKNESKIEKLSKQKLERLYKSCISSKNFGDINLIDTKKIPEHDLFTYSFPCQDISTLGEQLSCAEDSGTRSSLLWESKKIIQEKRPKYLLLENVKNLAGKRHKDNFQLWIKWLEIQGYNNHLSILDSKEYGIPQRRPRVFMVSILGEHSFSFRNLVKFKGKYDLTHFLDTELSYEKIYNIKEMKTELNGVQIKKFSIEDGEIKFWDDRDWKLNGIMIQDICSTQRAGRSGLKCVVRESEFLKVRKLTALECWRLMGFYDNDYHKVVEAEVTKTQILKQCGNSIVVNVLEAIFLNLFNHYIQDKRKEETV